MRLKLSIEIQTNEIVQGGVAEHTLLLRSNYA